MNKKSKKFKSKYISKGISILLLFLLSIIFSFTAYNLINASSDNIIHETSEIQNSNNSVIVDNKPFFPFGFYYRSLTRKQRKEALEDIAAAGFNTIFVYCWHKVEDYGEFLDEAQKLGVHVITQLHEPDLLAPVQQFKDKSAVLGWGIADDAGEYESRSEVLKLHKQVKDIDPVHSTYISVSWAKNWASYASVADIIGGQSYPIQRPHSKRPKGLPSDISEVNYIFNVGRVAAEKYNHPIIANLQTFPWEGKRWPNAKEIYNMTYQALLAGVKGIIFYTYQNSSNFIRENPELWNQVKSIVPEIKSLTPVLLEGKLTKIKTGFNDLLIGQWTHNKSVYLVIVNTSTTQIRKVNIAIPTQVTGSLQPLFRNRSSGMNFRNGKLSGDIQAEDVHVYKLSMV